MSPAKNVSAVMKMNKNVLSWILYIERCIEKQDIVDKNTTIRLLFL